jgi:catechol 2,3-dioxygenase-like lactoylglutathione lyase family enzyme
LSGAVGRPDVPDLDAHHYGVIVTDLDRMVAFYRDTLGLDVLDRFSVSGAAFAEAVGVPGATGRFAHLDAGGARVELVAYDPPGEDRSGPAVNDAGGTHLGFSVPDVDAFDETLPSSVETLSEPRTSESGTRILFVRDPEGNLVEVIES